LFSIGKPPRLRDQWMLRDIFLLARPPLLAVMQGGEFLRSPATRFRVLQHSLTREGISCNGSATAPY